VQRDLADVVGPEKDGQTNVKGAGLKKLLRDTDTGALYFKSMRSTDTQWILVQVKLGADGKTYEKSGTPDRVVDVPKKLPRTKQEWQRHAFVSDDAMLYPRRDYPHITFDLNRAVRDPGDLVEFETFHYSRTKDDPYRSGYRMSATACLCVDPPDKKEKAKECDDEVDKFLAAVGYPMTVTRKKT
jgi:hypothetical protein